MGAFLTFLLRLLRDQRGELGDDPDDPGEPTDPIDPLDPDDDPGEPPDDPGEPADDDPPKPADLDDDGEPVPYKRFSKVYGEFKTTKEKFDLFKRLGPDKFYEVYPDEKPEEPAGEPPEKPIVSSEAKRLVVQGGEYDGMTLGEVEKVSPLDAQDILLDFRMNQQKEIDENRRIKTESEQEETDFKAAHAKEAFGKEYTALTPVEQDKIDEVISATIDWMDQTGRGGGKLFDAYYLMNRGNELSKAKGDAASKTVESLTRGAVQSISGVKSSEQAGYGAYANLSADQLSDKLDAMGEDGRDDFYRKAPASIRDKFPDLPWE